MADIAKYTVRLEAATAEYEKSLRKANKLLTRFNKNQSRQLKGIQKGFLKLAASIGGFGAAFAAVRKTVDTGRLFQKLSAQLLTVEKSADKAKLAFEGIREFTAQTPFQLEEVTRAYTTLKTRGIDPTNEALLAFGNIAAGQGRSLQQFVEAVADAVTNEFERLKEFGIIASQSADQVSFTFNQVETTVKKDAASIGRYLTDLGNIEFAGAVEAQMATVDGAMSNLQDATSNLALAN